MLALWWVVAATAAAEPSGGSPGRVAVAAQVKVDGRSEDAGPFQALLSAALQGKGARVVDADQTRALREQMELWDAASGKLPAGLSELDADWVLVAAASCKTFQIDVRPTQENPAAVQLHSANCDATVTLVRADSGDRAGSASLFGKAPAAHPREAVRRALEKISAGLAERELGAMLASASAFRSVVLWLFGAEERAAADQVREAVGKLPSVKACSVTAFAPEVTRLEVQLKQGNGVDLSREMDAAADLPVRIERASGGRVTARMDSGKRFRTTYTVKPFVPAALKRGVNLTRLGVDARTMRGLNPQVFRELKRQRALAREAKLAHARLQAALANIAFLERAERPEAAEVVFTGQLAAAESGQVQYRIRAVNRRGQEVIRFEAAGPEDIVLATRRAEPQLPVKLAMLQGDRGRRELLTAEAPRVAEREERARAVVVAAADAADIFPAKAPRYAGDEPLATVQLRSRTGAPVEGVRVNAELVGFSAGPRLSEPVTVTPDGVSVPIRVAVDSSRLLAVEQATVGQLKVELQWKQGDAERGDRFVVPVRVLERGAIRWTDGEMAAAFVTPRDPAVKELVAAALRAGAAGEAGAEAALGPELSRAVRATEALAALAPRYAPDPVVPFGTATDVDFVNLPGETLRRGTGDCDDLAVLLSAALESAGLSTRLITTPGHILVAFDAGLPPALAADLDFARGEGLAVGDRTLVPLEATALSRGFLAAWEEGAREVARYAGKPELQQIPVREAWRRYPPAAAELPGGARPEMTSAEALEGQVRKALAAVQARRQDALARRLADLEGRARAAPGDPAVASARAVTLAVAGRLDEAAEAARAAGAASPEARLTLANVLAIKGDLGAAREALSAGAATAGSAAAAYHHNLAVVQHLLGDGSGAVASMARAMTLDPGVAAADADEGTVRASDAAPGAPKAEAIMKADLQDLLKKAREQMGKKLDAAPPSTVSATETVSVAAGRRGADPAERRQLALVLKWVLPGTAPGLN
jgi:transglutaminase-like putative cysteine protease